MGRVPKILALDDSLTMRKLIEVVFAPPAFELSLATTGAEALAAAPKVRPDIILLDYVLPDMHGTEVCEALSRHEFTRSTPILITSAKGDRILEEFKSFSTVVGFVPKPFRPADILKAVGDVLKNASRSDQDPRLAAANVARKPEASKLSPLQLERAARSLFSVLQPHLLKMSEWLQECGSERADRFLAKKLLNARVIEGLLEALQPTMQETRSGEASPVPARLSGSTDTLSLQQLLRVCEESRFTGSFQFQAPGVRAFVHMRAGHTILASLDDPARYRAACDSSGVNVSAEASKRAEQQQRESGIPIFVSYAQDGLLSMQALPRLLSQGTSFTLRTLSRGQWSFRSMDGQVLPAFADAHGTPHTAASLRLEILRDSGDPDAQWKVKPDDILMRAEGFSERIRHLELSAEERTVLTLVNGRNSLAEVRRKSNLSERSATHVVWRLHQCGLLYAGAHATQSSAGPAAGVRHGKVLVLEPDQAVVVPLLRQRLANCSRPQDLVLLQGAEEIKRYTNEQIEAVIMNCSSHGMDPLHVVENIRGTLELADLMMIGILEPEESAKADELRASGFDAVLVKPFLLDDLDAYLAVA